MVQALVENPALSIVNKGHFIMIDYCHRALNHVTCWGDGGVPSF